MRAPDFSIFTVPLDAIGVDYMVTGSVAAMIYGEPRMTHDVDLVLHLTPKHLEAFCAAFPGEGYYCPPPEVIRVELARRERAHFNLIHHASGLKADCYLFTGDELHAWAMQHRARIQLEDGLSMWLAPPEYVIIRKLEYYREGGSDKHLRYIEGIVAVSGDAVDWSFVESCCEQRGLQAFLRRARANT